MSGKISASRDQQRKQTRHHNLSERLRRTGIALLVFSALIPLSLAVAQSVPEDLLTIGVTPAGPVAPGSEGYLTVELQIDPSWHINANPPSEDFLVPTEVSLTLPAGITSSTPQYPAGKSLAFDFSDVPLDVYEHNAEIVVPVSVAADTEPGEYEFSGTVFYQACNDQICLAPATREFNAVLTVQEGAAAMRPPVIAGSGDGQIYSAPEGGISPEQSSIRKFLEENAFLAFLSLFGMGLALNLTPCVYPMMSVTIALFGSREETSAVRRLPAALVYLLGICFMYSALGLLAAFTGTLFGSVLQSPLVLIGIGVVLAALALSMFGLYELQVPSSLLSKVGGQNTAGLVGVFLSGLMVGVFAAPCIGPPIVALLAVVGQSGDPMFGFWAFFVLSLGLGLPYLLLATYSGLLQRMPRSGTWMIWVKQVFGVILLAVALFYISLAINDEWSSWVVPVTLVLGGLYLGFIERTGNEARAFAWVKRLLGAGAVAAGIFMVVSAPGEGVIWDPYTPEVLENARVEGQPVILDFYATWCLPCKELDHSTFTDPRVIQLAQQFRTLKVDLTKYDSPEAEDLRNRFQVDGVPTIVFLGPDGHEVAGTRVVGFVGPTDFVQLTEKALNAKLSATRVSP